MKIIWFNNMTLVAILCLIKFVMDQHFTQGFKSTLTLYKNINVPIIEHRLKVIIIHYEEYIMTFI